jgi:hypothetical protein
MSRPVRADELDDEREESALPGSEAPAARTAGVAGTVALVQATAGNAATQRVLSGARVARAGPPPPPPPGAVTHHTTAEIKAMTLTAFDRYAKDQADWALDPGVAAEKGQLQALLEFARAEELGLRPILGGCGDMTVQALLDTGLDAAARDDLRFYSRAVVQSEAHPTIKLQAVDNVGKARVYGAALRKLEVMPGGVTIKKVFNEPEALDRLLAFGAVDSFQGYCTAKSPLLQAEDDAKSSPEITSYLAFHAAGDEAFIGSLPDVRNLHRFEHAALQRLTENLATPPDKVVADKRPLVLLLHSSFDHNGAFHRDPNMTTVITQPDKLVLLVEGKESLAAMQGDLAGIAARYGHDGKIHEVMLAGHGDAHSIEMTGKLDAKGKQVGEDVATKDPASDAFMAELVKNMATGPDSRIVLNACLTASNKVKAPVDPKTNAPKLSDDPDAAANEVMASIKADPSLKDSIQAVAGKGTQVRGSNASFGQVGLLDKSGHLDVVSAVDEKLTAPKNEYALKGNEPQGVMRALLETWAKDRTDTPKTTIARGIVDVRKKDETTPWNPRVISSLMRAIDRKFDNGELMRRLAEGAGALSELGQDKNPAGLGWIPAGEADAIYTDMAKADEWAGQPKLPLLAYQHWLQVSPAQGANFKAQLVNNFTCRTAQEFVKIEFLKNSMAALLPAGTATPAKADLELALLGVIGPVVDPVAKQFLKDVAGTNAHFDAALGIDALLDNASQQDAVETIIGLTSTAPAAAATATGPANTDLDGDGAPDVFIEPMERKSATTTARTQLHSRPVERGRLVTTLRPNARLIVIGKSGDFYVVEHGTTPRFVLQTDVALGEKPNVDIDGDGVNDFHVESVTRRAAVTANHLNVRMFPGLEERIVASLPKGAEVMVDGTSGDWFAIEHARHTRFVHKDWLEFKPVA